MAEIKYTDHLNLRLSVRKIPIIYPKIIYDNPEQRFFDNIEKTNISIKRLKYNYKFRNMMIAYEKNNGEVEIVTIHPIIDNSVDCVTQDRIVVLENFGENSDAITEIIYSDEKIANRLISGRWSKNE